MSHHDFRDQISLSVSAQAKTADERRHIAMLQALDPVQQADEVFCALVLALDSTTFSLDFYHPLINGRAFSDDHPERTRFLRTVFSRFMCVQPGTPDRVITLRRGSETHEVPYRFYVNVIHGNAFYLHASNAQKDTFLRTLTERIAALQRDTEAAFEAAPCMAAARQIASMTFSDVKSLYVIRSAEGHNATVHFGLDPYALKLMRFFHAHVFGDLISRYASCANFHLTLHLTKDQYDALLSIRGTLYSIGLELCYDEKYADERVNYNDQGLLDLDRGKAIRREKRARYAANAAARKKK